MKLDTTIFIAFTLFSVIPAEARIGGSNRQQQQQLQLQLQQHDNTASKTQNPYQHDYDTLGPAAHCLDQDYLQETFVSYRQVDSEYPCLRDYCASISTEDQCNLEENFQKGCGWCGGSCKPYISFQDAFTQCVRLAYADHEPTKVNGQTLPFSPTNTTEDEVFADGPIGLPEQGNIPNLGNKRWTSSKVHRNAGGRVPIHVHPFSGLSCIEAEGGSTINIEGHDSFFLPSGSCYSMPPMTKIGPHSANVNGGGAEYYAHDTFIYEACYPTWVVIEPDAYPVQYGQFDFISDIQCNNN